MDSQNSGDPCPSVEILLDEVVRTLSRWCAFPVPVNAVTVPQTHISTAFRGGGLVYKVKKPMRLPFLDFSTAEVRRQFCEEEVRFNRPWAPDGHLALVPITRNANGLRFEGSGPLIDWAVKLRRTAESTTLRSRLQDGSLELCHLERVARHIATTHQQASPLVEDQGVEANSHYRRRWTENREFARHLSANVIEPQVQERLQTLPDEWMQRYKGTLVQRAADGRIQDVHGDLWLGHVFQFPEAGGPALFVCDGLTSVHGKQSQ